MSKGFASNHARYREEIDMVLEEVPASVRESVRRGVYKQIGAIYIDFAHYLLDNPITFARIQEIAKSLSREAGDLGKENPAVRLLRDEASKYSTLAKGKNPHNDPDYVFGKVKYILVDQLGVEPGKVKMESDLAKDLGPDSLDIVDIGMEIDSELGIKIPDGDLAGFKTVGDIVNYVMERSSKGME